MKENVTRTQRSRGGWMHIRPAFRSSPLTKVFHESCSSLQCTTDDGVRTLTKVNIAVVELIFFAAYRAFPSTSRNVLTLEEKHRWALDCASSCGAVLSPFLPPWTAGFMAVNCQVGAQEKELRWFYSQVATALIAEAASEQQRASCPEQWDVRKASFPRSLKLKVQRDEIVLTMEGNTEEQNNASPPRREELHLCQISSNTLSRSSLPSQIFPRDFISVLKFTFDSSTCTFFWLSWLMRHSHGRRTHMFWRVPLYQSSWKSDKAQQNITSSPCCQIKLWDRADLSVWVSSEVWGKSALTDHSCKWNILKRLVTYFGGISGKYRSCDGCRHYGVPLQLFCCL